eukprot:3940843-Rhodomonas_salina.2
MPMLLRLFNYPVTILLCVCAHQCDPRPIILQVSSYAFAHMPKILRRFSYNYAFMAMLLLLCSYPFATRSPVLPTPPTMLRRTARRLLSILRCGMGEEDRGKRKWGRGATVGESAQGGSRQPWSVPLPRTVPGPSTETRVPPTRTERCIPVPLSAY